MSEQRDGTGTGTGVWAHPAAEPEPEQRRCECGQSEFDGRVWSWRGVGTRRVCVANSTLSGYCPACGCRLSVVDGEPRVGEPYAELELERRAVEALAEHIEIACEGFSHGSMSAITVAPGGYMDAAEIAAWARKQAREEVGGAQ